MFSKEVIELSQLIVSTCRKVDGKYLTATPNVVHLLLGTCAVESNFMRYRKQLGDGPARGIFQIEPFTAVDLIDRVLHTPSRQHIYDWVMSRLYTYENPYKRASVGQAMIKDDPLSIVIARTKYRSNKMPIPFDIEGIAKVWKSVYNTELGKGTTRKFVQKYEKYIGDFQEVDNYLRSL